MELLRSLLIETNKGVGVRSLKQLIRDPSFKKKHSRLVDNLKKKMVMGSFDSELAYNAFIRLVEGFAEDYPQEVIDTVATELYESEDVEITEETEEETELKNIVSEVFRGVDISTKYQDNVAIATLEFDNNDQIKSDFPKVYDAIEGRIDRAKLFVYISSLGLGFSLFSINENGVEDKYADTDVYGNYPSSAMANRIIALLNNNSKIKRILENIK